MIRYTPKILLFVKPVLPDVPSQYFCFLSLCCQIYPQNIAVSGACGVRYTPTIFLFLKTVLSDIPSQNNEVFHAAIFCVMNQFLSGMSNSLEQLTLVLQAAYLCVSPIHIFRKLTNSLYVRIISDN